MLASARLTRAARGGHHSNVRTSVVSSGLCNVPCFKADLVARLRAGLPSLEALEEARISFAALADRTRLKILYALTQADELCV